MPFPYKYTWLLILALAACKPNQEAGMKPRFSLLKSEQTGVDFINQLDQTEELNTYTFRNFYNGAGVGLGDFNNDGLIDVYFCGNTVDNKLFLNKGQLKFEDITEKAGVACKNVWSTGVAIADINADGFLDIYVSKSGPKTENRHNELFINNGDLTFSEQSQEYGLDIEGLSVQASFFDYDKDGDLDCYLLNNSFTSVDAFEPEPGLRDKRDPNGANKLLRNDDQKFIDVTAESGIYSSAIGFGLGVAVSDINKDCWPDIYITNDFFEKDYLYINNHDGTFTESLEEQMREISMGAMGVDAADIDNDGFPEIYVTEMTPEGDVRVKTKAVFESWGKYEQNLKNGYYNQFARNTLQLNNQDSSFSEIGRFAGVSTTDWSWAPLILDLDNDGFKDIFVTNGIFKDLLDRDYLEFYSNPRNVRNILNTTEKGILALIEKMPSVPISNYAFLNHGDLTFSNQSENLGLDLPGFSNGTAYGDLDNDGDLDLVINNINMPAFIYQNNTEMHPDSHFLSIQLKGDGKNTSAIGAQVTVYANDKTFYQELIPTRGFMSSVDKKLIFGLGNIDQVDSIYIVWPDNKKSILKQLNTNQEISIAQSDAIFRTENVTPKIERVFSDVTKEVNINLRHTENDFNDFDREKLLFHMRSTEGPKISVADVNGDGKEDFYICGAKDSPGALLTQTSNGFQKTNLDLFEKEKISEETDCLFFDADSDGDMDLYVACGGIEFTSSSSALIDKLYFNDGNGIFKKSNQVLPSFLFQSSSCVKASDFDGDGDLDLFIGVRLRPFLYGVPADSYILENDGKGIFKDVTNSVAHGLKEIGMVKDAVWVDIDGDEDEDLIVVGEWMPIVVFINEDGMLNILDERSGLNKTNGWWNVIAADDIDGDGDIDFVAGNLGYNSRFKSSPEHPVKLYVNDFDLNGSIEQLVCMYSGDTLYPLVLKPDLMEQMPGLQKKYQKFSDYAGKRIEDIFPEEVIQKSVIKEAYHFGSALFLNDGHGHFEMKELPSEAQFSPVYGILIDDFNEDGIKDVLIGGNLTRVKPEIGIYNSSYGLFLQGTGNADFIPLKAKQSGFKSLGEIRDFEQLNIKGKKNVLIAKNNDLIQIIRPVNK